MRKLLLFHTEMIFLLENVLCGGELQIDVKNSNFEIWGVDLIYFPFQIWAAIKHQHVEVSVFQLPQRW